MKKMIRRLTLVFAVAMMLVGMSPVMAMAKNVKIKGATFTTSKDEAAKSAKTVGKGTVNVSFSQKSSGFLKFTAPAEKKYSFTVSNIKSNKYTCGFFYIMTEKSYGEKTYIGQVEVATQGGKTRGLYVATKNSKTKDKLSRFLKSRTGSIKLTKGQTIFLYFDMSSNCSFRLKIK